MNKFHVNPQTGEVGRCRAVGNGCPFGSAEDHYTSEEAARKAYENSMESETIKVVKNNAVARRVEVDWSDLTEEQRALVSRQDTALREEYFLAREFDARMTHEVVWPVIKRWDDLMMSTSLPDGTDPLDSFYENEGGLGGGKYTNPYDAKVRFLKRITGEEYPLFEEL